MLGPQPRRLLCAGGGRHPGQLHQHAERHPLGHARKLTELHIGRRSNGRRRHYGRHRRRSRRAGRRYRRPGAGLHRAVRGGQPVDPRLARRREHRLRHLHLRHHLLRQGCHLQQRRRRGPLVAHRLLHHGRRRARPDGEGLLRLQRAGRPGRRRQRLLHLPAHLLDRLCGERPQPAPLGPPGRLAHHLRQAVLLHHERQLP